MRNMPPISNDFTGQPPNAQKWGSMPRFPQKQRQLKNQPMFLRDQGRGMLNGAPRPLLQTPNNCLLMPIGEPLFNQGPFNRGGLGAGPTAQSDVEPFKGSPDRGSRLQLNRSPVKGPGFQFNCSPNREPGFHLNHSPQRGWGFPLNNSPERGRGFQLNNSLETTPNLLPGPPNRSPNRGPGLQFNRSPEMGREFQLNLSLERSTGQLHGPPSRSPERPLDFYRCQLSRSPERGSRGRRSRSRSRSRSPLNPSRPNILGRDSRRGSPPYRRGPSPGPRPGIGSWRLSGSRMKWYTRYRKKGFSHDEALCMAKEPTQPAASYKLALEAPMREPMPSRDNPDDDEFIQNNEPLAPMNEGERIGDRNELTVCLVPVGYPNESLTHQDKLDLQEAILHEVVMAGPQTAAPLRFSNISFKPGFLKVNCANQVAADWLLQTGSRLYSYNGRPVEAKLGSVKAPGQKIFISIFLPCSAGKSDEFLLSLLKSQNQYNTNLWKLASRKDHGGGAVLVLGIDKESAADIAANDHSIFYRYGTVPVRGLRRDGKKPPPKPLANRVPRNPISVNSSSPISKRGRRNSPSAKPSSPISKRGRRNTPSAKSSSPMSKRDRRNTPSAKSSSPMSKRGPKNTPSAKPSTLISKRGSKHTPTAKHSTPIASRSPEKTASAKRSTPIASRSPEKTPVVKPSTSRAEEKPQASFIPKIEPEENPQVSPICIDLATDEEDH
ncbi:GH21982 [Drosophila grimshawi]|uniref:GH21982 n=1 Tax=Drosophila grimshawi TaxID=7222 RepID=B4J946_DROGR|nr:GH21982 [Drosophila grimshawi]